VKVEDIGDRRGGGNGEHGARRGWKWRLRDPTSTETPWGLEAAALRKNFVSMEGFNLKFDTP
jgi:hypothetical protein